METGRLVTEDKAMTETPEEVSWVLLLVLVKVKPCCAHWDHTSETQTELEFLVLVSLLFFGMVDQNKDISDRLSQDTQTLPRAAMWMHVPVQSWGCLEEDKAVRAAPNHYWGLLQSVAQSSVLQCVASPQPQA